MDLNFKKARQTLGPLSFKERLKAVASLGKNSIAIIGRDEDIIKPWVRLLIYNGVMVNCFFYAWLDIAMTFVRRGKMFGGGILMVLIRLFVSRLEEVLGSGQSLPHPFCSC